MKHFSVHGLSACALAFAVWTAACSDAGTTAPVASGSNTAPTAQTSVAVSMVATAPLTQTGAVGTNLPEVPVVKITDGSGAAVAGATVTFTVTAGGGAVQYPSVVTDANGLASAGRWTLGPGPGTNTLEAHAGTLNPVVFTATATPIVNYNITIRYIATATARQQQAVAAAVARWQSVIATDLPNIPLNAPSGACFATQPAINETVDDIIIFVEFVDIDGVNNVLGEAGPCYVRSDSKLPLVGRLKLDNADLAAMERNGTIDDVVLHEMGHILGIGTLWPDKNLLSGAGTADPRFTGNFALNAYRGLGGLDAFVAVENTGGAGTRDGHWRESVFGNELMTGYISGTGNPMSALTVASLSDLGYGTNSNAAASYTLSRTSSSVKGTDLHRGEVLKRPKYRVDRNGRTSKFGV